MGKRCELMASTPRDVSQHQGCVVLDSQAGSDSIWGSKNTSNSSRPKASYLPFQETRPSSSLYQFGPRPVSAQAHYVPIMGDTPEVRYERRDTSQPFHDSSLPTKKAPVGSTDKPEPISAPTQLRQLHEEITGEKNGPASAQYQQDSAEISPDTPAPAAPPSSPQSTYRSNSIQLDDLSPDERDAIIRDYLERLLGDLPVRTTG